MSLSFEQKDAIQIFEYVFFTKQPRAPQDLLELALKVRENFKPQTSILAVHCHSGVGRTGTFIAAFILIHELEKQLSRGIPLAKVDLSIEAVVRKLSLQRYHMVSPPGYVMLYKVLALYCEHKNRLEKNAIRKRTVVKGIGSVTFAASALFVLYKIFRKNSGTTPSSIEQTPVLPRIYTKPGKS